MHTLRQGEPSKPDETSDSRILQFPAINDRANRTFMCTVLFLDIVEYAKKGVADQLKSKEHFNNCISEAIQDVAVNDRIILDTGDGAAVNFLGDPEDALVVATRLAQLFPRPSPEGTTLPVRIGINLGPVRLVRDINGQPNIIGDGINVAERVMSFARPGQVLVSRQYYETVTGISREYERLFAYQGSRTDKHVREHEVYEVTAPAAEALEVAARRYKARPKGRPTLADLTDSNLAEGGATRGKLTRHVLPYAVAGLSCLGLIAAIVFFNLEPKHDATPRVTHPVPTRAPKPVEPPPAQASNEGPPPLVAAVSAPPPVEKIEEPKPAPEPKPTRPHRHTRKNVASAAKPAHRQEAPEPRPAPTSEAPAAKTPTAATPAPKPAGPTALVTLAISPWGEVLIDGKSVGVSPPMNELEVAPGMHRIEIRNGEFKPYLDTLELEPNQTIRIKHKFHNR